MKARIRIIGSAMLILLVMAAIMTPAALAYPTICIPVFTKTDFSTSTIAPGESVTFFYHHTRDVCITTRPCSIGVDGTENNLNYSNDYDLEVWLDPGTGNETLLGTFSGKGEDGAEARVLISGTFEIPADAGSGSHNVVFRLKTNINVECGGEEWLQYDEAEDSYGFTIAEANVQQDAYSQQNLTYSAITPSSTTSTISVLPETGAFLPMSFLGAATAGIGFLLRRRYLRF